MSVIQAASDILAQKQREEEIVDLAARLTRHVTRIVVEKAALREQLTELREAVETCWANRGIGATAIEIGDFLVALHVARGQKL